MNEKFSNPKRASITAVSSYVPDYVLTNAELEEKLDTTDEWIVSKTGISERRILKGTAKGSSIMGTQAAKKLLEHNNIDPKEIDLVICATVTPDMFFPANANIISNNIGATNAWSFDILAACSGFLYSVVVGSQFIESGRYKKVIVIGTDKMSSIVDYQDRRVCVIFGDGGGAVLLEPSKDSNGIISHDLHVDGSGEQHLNMKAGGSRYPAAEDTVKNKEHYLYQDGKLVFKHAVSKMESSIRDLMAKNNFTKEDIDFVVPHQANQRIIQSLGRALQLDSSKVVSNIAKYGNTTAATIPLAMKEWENKFSKGDTIILVSFGGGFAWGSVYLKWSY